MKKEILLQKSEGKEVTTVAELNKIKYNYKIGDTVTLTILRSGQEKELKVTLGEEPVTEENDNKDNNSSSQTQQNEQQSPNQRGGSSSIWDLFR